MKHQGKSIKKSKGNKLKKIGLLILQVKLLLFCSLKILPVKATTSEPVLSIIYTQTNANQWTGITNRLQATGVKYCVISLDNIKSAADLGDRPVVFLPNVENLTPTVAIALEEWMSKGGRLIASGAVGSLSTPGVRQLLQTLLGGYWGFSLESPQNLQLAPAKTQAWVSQNSLIGKVHGGVVVPNNVAARAVAVWDAKDRPAAVLTTERSTLLGWRWGVDTVSPSKIDAAWLQAALNRHADISSGYITKVAGGSPNCYTSVEAASKDRGNTATAPANTFQPSDEAIDQLQQAVNLNVEANSNAPISRTEAIALQQQLENLINRVESANLAAAAYNGDFQATKERQAQLASTKTNTALLDLNQSLTQVRETAKNLPQLIANKQYAQARSSWLQAKAALWQLFPLDRRLAQPEIRAIWLDRGTIVRARSEKGLAQIFDRLAQAGINTVFFETVNAGYTIYPSHVAPQQNPLIRGWDPLAAAVKLAHERNMELHAWVWTFAAGNQRHNQILNIKPDYPGPILDAFPDWAGYDQRGQMIPLGQGKPFLDPANPQARQYLLRLYEEIVTRYKVDGLQLDYIRYPFQDEAAGRTYGYGQAARRQFQQLTGVDPVNISPSQKELWQKWTQFRTEQVNSFVAQVSQQLRSKRSNLILSAAVFPLKEQERIQKIQQHWEVWAKRGDVDLIIPMTYAQDTFSFERLAQPWIASSKIGSALLVPGIRLLSLPTIGAFDQIQLVRDLPISGYALFAAENFHNDLQKVFSRTQGREKATPIEPTPLRQPFQTAAARYAVLLGEWNFVRQNRQLRLPATVISEFNTQAEVLQDALNQLAAKPNASKLQAAKASIVRFQSQFRTWMRLQALDNPYQVRVWENRLATIERLLRYGERTAGR
ncbi:MAG: family 10 glycosylhydrolase [Chlorogloeopsis fritschii C42_A2020_084]|uniref:family 10 glycosylhydrolase n=1 Tax=Chlorogloeopsis fritschii TaxID=1124 RepID=UPI0019F213B8|nr:family 10 glycosylhydrolase [Chlorogloeopsis fritschii]MBF2004520.1 family 10 glycosylhydrolase [Chlorogloeopsis fritschii C42_A2020_084]